MEIMKKLHSIVRDSTAFSEMHPRQMSGVVCIL